MISKNTYRIASLALFSAAAIFISTNAASAATITVINNSDSGAGSLRQAIIDSSSGDIINCRFFSILRANSWADSASRPRPFGTWFRVGRVGTSRYNPAARTH